MIEVTRAVGDDGVLIQDTRRIRQAVFVPWNEIERIRDDLWSHLNDEAST